MVDFLKPNVKKVVVFVILLALSFITLRITLLNLLMYQNY